MWPPFTRTLLRMILKGDTATYDYVNYKLLANRPTDRSIYLTKKIYIVKSYSFENCNINNGCMYNISNCIYTYLPKTK